MDDQIVTTLHRKEDIHVRTRKDIKRMKNEHSENLVNRFQEYAGALSSGKEIRRHNSLSALEDASLAPLQSRLDQRRRSLIPTADTRRKSRRDSIEPSGPNAVELDFIANPTKASGHKTSSTPRRQNNVLTSRRHSVCGGGAIGAGNAGEARSDRRMSVTSLKSVSDQSEMDTSTKTPSSLRQQDVLRRSKRLQEKLRKKQQARESEKQISLALDSGSDVESSGLPTRRRKSSSVLNQSRIPLSKARLTPEIGEQSLGKSQSLTDVSIGYHDRNENESKLVSKLLSRVRSASSTRSTNQNNRNTSRDTNTTPRDQNDQSQEGTSNRLSRRSISSEHISSAFTSLSKHKTSYQDTNSTYGSNSSLASEPIRSKERSHDRVRSADYSSNHSSAHKASRRHTKDQSKRSRRALPQVPVQSDTSEMEERRKRISAAALKRLQSLRVEVQMEMKDAGDKIENEHSNVGKEHNNAGNVDTIANDTIVKGMNKSEIYDSEHKSPCNVDHRSNDNLSDVNSYNQLGTNSNTTHISQGETVDKPHNADSIITKDPAQSQKSESEWASLCKEADALNSQGEPDLKGIHGDSDINCNIPGYNKEEGTLHVDGITHINKTQKHIQNRNIDTRSSSQTDKPKEICDNMSMLIANSNMHSMDGSIDASLFYNLSQESGIDKQGKCGGVQKEIESVELLCESKPSDKSVGQVGVQHNINITSENVNSVQGPQAHHTTVMPEALKHADDIICDLDSTADMPTPPPVPPKRFIDYPIALSNPNVNLAPGPKSPKKPGIRLGITSLKSNVMTSYKPETNKPIQAGHEHPMNTSASTSSVPSLSKTNSSVLESSLEKSVVIEPPHKFMSKDEYRQLMDDLTAAANKPVPYMSESTASPGNPRKESAFTSYVNDVQTVSSVPEPYTSTHCDNQTLPALNGDTTAINRPPLHRLLQTCTLHPVDIPASTHNTLKIHECPYYESRNLAGDLFCFRPPTGKKQQIGPSSAFLPVSPGLPTPSFEEMAMKQGGTYFSLLAVQLTDDVLEDKESKWIQDGDFVIEVNGECVLSDSFEKVQAIFSSSPDQHFKLTVARPKSQSSNTPKSDTENATKEVDKLRIKLESLKLEADRNLDSMAELQLKLQERDSRIQHLEEKYRSQHSRAHGVEKELREKEGKIMSWMHEVNRKDRELSRLKVENKQKEDRVEFLQKLLLQHTGVDYQTVGCNMNGYFLGNESEFNEYDNEAEVSAV